jgi:hypothetical protein
MMALTTLSLAMATAYRRRHLLWIAVLSGLALAAAVLFKLFALEAAVPALWLLWDPEDNRLSLRAAGLFLASAVLPVAAEFLLVSPAQQWDQVVSMHQRAATSALPGLLSPFTILRDLAGTDPGLIVLGVAGLVVLAMFAVWEDFVFLLLWIAGTVAMLVIFRPLFPHHAVILLPGIAVAAGVSVTVLVEQLRSRRWPASIPLAAAVLCYVLLSPRLARADRHVLIPGLPVSETRVAGSIRTESSPEDLVATDNLATADLASRLVPAPLCDLSNVRFKTGYARTPELIAATRKYHASLVVAGPGGIFSQAPGYLAWVGRNYRVAGRVDGTRIFVSPRR